MRKWRNAVFLRDTELYETQLGKDLIQFALPALTVFIIELQFCVRDGFSNFWGTVWGLIKQPGNLSLLPVHSIIGLALFFTGLTIMLVGQTTLWRNYSGTVIIREDHQLITHGIYRFTRNPIYLGGIMAVTGIPVWAASLYGFSVFIGFDPDCPQQNQVGGETVDGRIPGRVPESTKRQPRTLIPFIY